MANKISEKFDINRNLLIVLFLIPVIIGLFWLYGSGLEKVSGLYLMLFVISIVSLLFIIIFLIKENEAKYYLEPPIAKTNVRASAMFILGVISILLLFGVGKIFHLTIFENTMPKAFMPLASSSLSGDIGSKSFSTIKAQNDPFFTLFIIGPVASTIEELSVGLIFTLVFMIISYYFYTEVLKLNFGKTGNKILITSTAFILSTLLFSALHSFNSTYVTLADFMYAAMFRLIMNIFMFSLRFGESFTIGAHLTNNLIFLGWVDVFEGMTTGWGVILILIFVVIIINVLLNFKEVINVFNFRRLFTTWE